MPPHPALLPGALLAALFATATLLPAQEGPNAVKGPVILPPDLAAYPVEQAILPAPPHVPPPIKRKHAARGVVNLEVREVVKKIADGVDYTFWTFGGTVPGSFSRVREGDEVEFHLNNHPSSKLPHNIDLHAVTGPGGGAASTFTAPGYSSQFTFQTLNPGLYVYHCATAPVPMHIGNGMYGLILVEPKAGLPPVDQEYCVMQGDFYTVGRYGEEGMQPFDMGKVIDEHPTYVVFNGAVGSLVGDSALTAKVGETVRLFFGVGGPNLTSSFHVIGEIFDRVYPEGGKRVYMQLCFACHQPDGQGLPGSFPPLALSDCLKADRDRPIRIVLKGLSGPVTVNSVTYNGAMPPQEAVLSDQQIADALTYVTNSWGNTGDAYKADQVRAIRHETQ